MSSNTSIEKNLKVLRIIVAGMMGGIVIFLLVVLVIGRHMQKQSDLLTVMLPILLVFMVGAIFVPMVLRRKFIEGAQRMIQNGSDDDPAGHVFGIFNGYILISCAMAEGFGLFAVVIFLLTRSLPVLIIVAVSLILLILRFPTRSMVDQFVADARTD